MAKDETRRLQPSLLQEDRDSHAAIKAMDDYTPANPAYAKDKLQAAQDLVVAKREREVELEGLQAAARDATVAAEWAFHNLMLGAEDQVKAQYGANSDQLASVGKKKKSEYKAPRRKSTTPP